MGETTRTVSTKHVIVVPIDRSGLSEGLMAIVCLVAREMRSEVTLLHVGTDPFAAPQVQLTIDHRLPDWLTSANRQLSQAGISTQAVVRSGIVQAEVVAEAERRQADMIVMMTRPHRAQRWIDREGGGELADLLDHSPVPILVIQKGSPPATRLATILVAVDGTTEGDTILESAARLAGAANARLVLLHVRGDATESAQTVHLHSRAEKLLDAGLAAEFKVIIGTDVGRAITQVATEIEADLLAMATRPRERLTGLRLGRAVESVLRLTSQPLLLKNSSR